MFSTQVHRKMDYEEAIDWLYGTQLFGIKLGLDGTRRLFEKFDLFDSLEGRTIFHVAGTNGKGSVCAMIDSICRETDKRCGLFTSPHLVSFRERIRVNGEMIAESNAAQILTRLRNTTEHWDPHPTFFELALTLATIYFCQQDVEVLVMETGMGGRLDATNVLPSSISIITPVSLDHQQWLGEDLESIAAEKAGIIKPGVPLFTPNDQDPQVGRILSEKASSIKAPFHEVDTPNHADSLKIGLKGPHQQQNAALAKAAVQSLWPDIPASVISRGLQSVSWPGRFDQRAENFVIDGAHNPASMKALVSTWQEEFGKEARTTVIFGAADTKDIPSLLSQLVPIAERFLFVPLSAKRGLEPGELSSALSNLVIKKIPPWEEMTLRDALDSTSTERLPILVTGSLFLAGETLSILDETMTCFETSEQ